MALNSQLLTVQILTNDVQVLILCLSYFITTVHPWEDFFCSPSSLSIGRDINRIQLCEDPNIKFYKWFPPRKGNYKFTFLEPPNSGPSQGLKIRWGAFRTVVGIICPLVEMGLTVWPKTEGLKLPAPRLRQHWLISRLYA